MPTHTMNTDYRPFRANPGKESFPSQVTDLRASSVSGWARENEGVTLKGATSTSK